MALTKNTKICMDITDAEITTDLLQILLDLHAPIVSGRFKILDDYYTGEHLILLRVIEDDTKPNNKPVTNFCSYITDTLTGFFVGKPVSYTSKDKEFLEVLTKVFADNDEQTENHDLGHKASVKGQGFEVVYLDEEGNINFDCLDTDTILMIYDTSIKSVPLMAVRHYTLHNYILDTDVIKIVVYTKTNIYYYTDDGGIVLDSSEAHYFGEVPIVEYANNRYHRGDFENIITLNDMYNKNNADISNDIEYFSNAYLVLENMDGTESEDIDKINENRVILTSEGGKAYFLTKQLNDAVVQNHRNNLSEDIHKISYTPDLSKEIASNVSGNALKTKMFTTADIIVNKERKFKKSLQTRIKLIATILNLKGYKDEEGKEMVTHEYNYKDIAMKFHRNMPTGMYETADDVSKMSTAVSQKTLLTEIGIEDVDAEIEQIELEKSTMVDLDNLHTETPPVEDDPVE
ncbi:MAG TPA: phage portal protein [Clostridium sp.]